MKQYFNHCAGSLTTNMFRLSARNPRGNAVGIGLGVMLYNLFLQIGLCRFSGNDIELKNRIVLGSLLMPMLAFITLYLVKILVGCKTQRPVQHLVSVRFFMLMFSIYLALLSPLMTLFYDYVHSVNAVIVLLSAFWAASTRYGAKQTATRLFGQCRSRWPSIKRHALFILTIPLFFFVFLCEINDQWDVYEADGPYYGQFARNILRYDLSYTRLLRTHGTGDHAAPKNKKTHNLRHPNGYIVYLTAWYLIVGSDISRPAERVLPLLSNFAFLLMLYLFILKKSGSQNAAVGAVLIYILIPIASTFGGKIHQLSMMHTLLLLGIVAYDNVLDGSKHSLRLMLMFCALSLLTDWYAALFWPLIWVDYLVRYLRETSRFDVRPLYLLPAICILVGAVIFGHMLLGKISFGSFEYVANLRFNANSVKQFTMESFNNRLVTILVRDYTGIVYQVGVIWPILFVIRALRGRVDRLDIYTLICLVYGLANIYLFKKIFIHYFEIIHLLLYAVLAGCAMIRYVDPLTARLGRTGSALMTAIIVLSMLTDTVAGIRYYRLRHSGAYTDGYAEASEFIKANISRHETVVTNRIFNIYSNERHIFGNRLVKCNTVGCFKRIQENEDPAFVILFEKKKDAQFFKYVLGLGKVYLFHNHVVVVSLKSAPNLHGRIPAEKSADKSSQRVLTENVRLLNTSFPSHVSLKRMSFLETYFTSLNDDKFIERRFPVLNIHYTYQKSRSPKRRALEKRETTANTKDKEFYTEIRDDKGRVMHTVPHALTNTFYTPKYWPENRTVRETVTIPLSLNPQPGRYQVYLCSLSAEIPVGYFDLGERIDEIRKRSTAVSLDMKIERSLTKTLRLMGVTMPKAVSRGETLQIDTFYRTQAQTEEVVSPVIRIRDVLDGDLTFPVRLDPLSRFVPGTVYRYSTEVTLSAFAFGGKKKVFLEAEGKRIELGTVEIRSPRRRRAVLVEEAAVNRRFKTHIVEKKKRLEIDFNARKRRAVQLLFEAEYTEKPSGYTVMVYLSKSKHNGGRRHTLQSDIVQKTLLSKDRYHHEIVIPSTLVRRGKNHVIVAPLKPGRIEKTYPGWRNAAHTLLSPALDGLLRRDLTGKLPLFSYIAVDVDD